MSFDVLRRMAKMCEPVASSVLLRCNQVSAFAKRPRYEHDRGFKITTRDPRGKVRGAEEKEIKRLEEFLLKTGSVPNRRRDNPDHFLRKLVRDSLVLDAYAIEEEPPVSGRTAGR